MSAGGPLLVAVDVGTTGARAAAIDLSGALVAEARRPYRTRTPQPGWAEQDAADWAEHAVAALRGALRRACRTRSGWPGSGSPASARRWRRWRRTGAPVGPGMLYRDNRAVAEARRDARRDRRRGDARAHGPRRRGVPHRAEGALAAPPPAGCVRRDAVVPAAARRRAAAADRARRDRRDARRRDDVLRPARAAVGGRPPGPVRRRPGALPGGAPALGDRRGAAGGGRGRRDRPARRDPGRDRRGRQPVRRLRRRRRRPGPGERDGRGVVVPQLGRDRAARRRAHHPLQPRRAGPLHDGARHQHERRRDRLGGAPARLPRSRRPGRRRRSAAPAACAAPAPTRASWRRSSCPTSATASATTPTCAARSSASRCATTGRRWPTRCSRGSPSRCTARSPSLEAAGSPVDELRVSGGGGRLAALSQIKADVLGRPVRRATGRRGSDRDGAPGRRRRRVWATRLPGAVASVLRCRAPVRALRRP